MYLLLTFFLAEAEPYGTEQAPAVGLKKCFIVTVYTNGIYFAL